jgi:hypothetical protein
MTVRRGTLHAVCFSFGLCSVAAAAFAQPSPAASVALAWQAPAGCPTQDEVLSALARANLEPAGSPALRVSAIVERTDDRWRALLHMSGALEAERTLEGDSCAALAETSVWLVAQTLRSLAPTRADEASVSLPEPENKQPQSVAADPVSASPQLERRSTVGDLPLTAAGARTLELAVAVWWDSGALPGSTVGLGFEVAFEVSSWRFAMQPRVFIPRRTDLAGAEPTAASASVWLVELPVQACYELALGELKIGPCASGIAGLMGGSSEGVPDARSSLGTWLAVEGAIAAVLPISARLGARAELALARPLRAPRFMVGEETRVHRTDDLVVRAGLSLGVHF